MSDTLRSEMPATTIPREQAEQRSRQRYPIGFRVEFALNRNGRTERGTGRTINVSSRGVLLQTKREMPDQGRIRLLLNWPVLLDGNCPIKLVMWGRIVRNDDNGVAIRFNRHEFRTVAKRPIQRESSFVEQGRA